MQIEESIQNSRIQKKNRIKTSTLILIGFATAFFSRLIDTAGAPSTINFLHLGLVPAISVYAIGQSRTRERRQIQATQALLFGLIAFLGAILASALINDAGIINVILCYLLWVEAYLFLCSIIVIPLSLASFQNLKNWLVRFSLFHIGLALSQKVLLEVGIMKTGSMAILEDNIQGVFYLSGGGHVVAASVSLAFGIYYFTEPKVSLPIKILILGASLVQLVVADAKQVLLVILVSWFILILTKLGDIKKALTYISMASVAIAVLLWCMQNVEAFRAFNTWVRPEIYGPEGEATLLKSAAIRIIMSHHENSFHWLFGLGPGHTVDRLGGWMLPKYWNLLSPLGATFHPASEQVWDAVWQSWLGKNSSMFSPLFGWAGLWGDTGFVGLVAYIFILGVVWSKICVDDISKFLLITTGVNGLIFSQMQEPGFMLYTVFLIGVRWQEQTVLASKKSGD